MATEGPGWGYPGTSRKAHYFPADNDTISLCRKWGFFRGDRFDDKHDHKDNCGECAKKRAKAAVSKEPGQS